MGKKIAKQIEQPRRTSTRGIKKSQDKSRQDEIFEQDNESEHGESSSLHDDASNSGQSDDNAQSGSDDEEESSSPPQVDPQNYAVRNMQFRQRRGTKMTYLIARKKEEDDDPFWAEHGANYFGDLDDGDNDEEDYEQSSSGRDEFDSDFNQTESQHDIEEEGSGEKEVDEAHQKEKKRRQELMRKIQAPAPAVKKTAQRTVASSSAVKKTEPKVESQRKIVVPQASSRYIHQLFNQEELLGQAATTEYFNWLSLKKLISIETEKKDFTKRSHHVEGPKVVFRDRFNAEGGREVSYELEGVVVDKVADLTKLLHQN